jgi:hypothetical protein
MSESQIRDATNAFLSDVSVDMRRDGYAITFERRPDWAALLQANNRDAILDDIAIRFADHNSHSMVMISKQHAIMFVVRSNRPARPATSIFDRLKNASEQFSRKRPAVVWGHFLGFGEDEFKELLEEKKLGHRALDVFGHHLFKSPNRNYICRLRLSVDGNGLRSAGQLSTTLILPNVINGGGPAYDLTSRVSKFDPAATQ